MQIAKPVMALGLAALVSVSAQGVNITFDSAAASDGSNLTTPLVGPNILIEDFDDGDACGLRPEVFAGISGSYSLQKGTISGQAAAPAGDSTCFLATPGVEEPLPGTVSLDFDLVLTSAPNQVIDYLGLYWGSIDEYNSFNFFDGETLLGTLTGADVIAAGEAQFGDQFSEQTNRYVNLFFDFDERFTRFELVSTSRAFEIDNVAVRVVQRDIPAPAPIGLLGLGLLGLAGLRSRRRG